MSFNAFKSFEPFVKIVPVSGGGGFSPISTSPAAWFSDTGSDASIWPDLSGNGFDISQATSGARPTIVSAVQNGLQARRFDGGDSLARSGIIGTQDYSFFIVCDFVTHTSLQPFLRNGAGSTGWRLDRRQSAGNQLNLAYSGVADVYNTATTSGWTIISVTRRTSGGNASNLWDNGTQLLFDAGGAMNNPATTFTMGGTNNISDIGEVLVWDRELTSTERTDIEAWLNAKWDIY